jgi:hypothetical protein
MNDNKICCICGQPFAGYGNNVAPFARGMCCDTCNNKYVIPYREYLTRKQSIRIEADLLARTQNYKHADAVLNGYIGKLVALTMWDGCVEVGVLHIDTVAVHYCTYSPDDNKEIIGYYIDTGKTELHFHKTIDPYDGKSVEITFCDGTTAAGFLRKTTVKGYYCFITPLRTVTFEAKSVVKIAEA